MMKKIGRVLMLAILAGTTSLSAQSNYGTGEDSVKCVYNIGLYEPYAKNGNFSDAYEFWSLAYETCPQAHRNLYFYGAQILKWKISQVKEATEKKAFFDKLMKLYDDRAVYFGDNINFPTPWIMGQKSIDYMYLSGKDYDMTKLYEMAKASIEGMSTKSDAQVVYVFIKATDDMYKAEKLTKEEYINNYQTAVGILDACLAEETKQARIDYTKQIQDYANSTFASSGAADCDQMRKIFEAKLPENKGNKDFLKQMVSLLRRVNCQELDVYFEASALLHKIEPSAESAMGIAKQAYKKGEIETSVKFFEEATQLVEDNVEKAVIQYNIASIYLQEKRYAKARQYALKSLEYDPNKGAPYILIGRMYALDAKSIYPDDAIMAKTVYYAAVDKMERAKQVDPSVSKEVAPLISNYIANYPRPDEVFMHGDIEKGKTITIGGWIQERTVVR